MADEELAPQGADDDAPQEGAQQQEEQREPTASEIAAELGWKPKDQWQGDPEAWKPADQFLRDGREMQQSATRHARSLEEQIARIGGMTEQLVNDRVAEARAQWEREFNQAVEDGDTVKAAQLAQKQPGAPDTKAPADPLEVTRWKSENQWFETHPEASALAAAVSQRLRHLPVAEQLTEAGKEVRKRFPELFPGAKPPPQTNGTGPRSANPSNRAKGFMDIPAESRAVFQDMKGRYPDLTPEAFAKSYWADQAKGSARA